MFYAPFVFLKRQTRVVQTCTNRAVFDGHTSEFSQLELTINVNQRVGKILGKIYGRTEINWMAENGQLSTEAVAQTSLKRCLFKLHVKQQQVCSLPGPL